MLLICLLTVSLTACLSVEEPAEDAQQENGAEEAAEEENAEETAAGDEEGTVETENTDEQTSGSETGSDILVAYFTYAENAELPDGVDAVASASIQEWNGETTGNTGAVAHMISEETGADLFSIRTVEKYPDNYSDTVDQGQEEQSEEARPELASHIEDISQYDTVFLGYPNWWGDMPMAVYSFLDEYDLSGKTVIPFVTSGGSRFSGTVSAIESAEPDAEVQEGIALSDSETVSAQEDVRAWLTGIGYAE
ncbi:flavodoxin [Mediterraneibacter glycyrrhizinilyticus]|nr:flavodoxin [Mediterraneibacter glycyrrhizinilyticus]